MALRYGRLEYLPTPTADDKREHKARVLKQAQEHKVVVTSKETVGFQVPLLICY